MNNIPYGVYVVAVKVKHKMHACHFLIKLVIQYNPTLFKYLCATHECPKIDFITNYGLKMKKLIVPQTLLVSYEKIFSILMILEVLHDT